MLVCLPEISLEILPGPSSHLCSDRAPLVHKTEQGGRPQLLVHMMGLAMSYSKSLAQAHCTQTQAERISLGVSGACSSGVVFKPMSLDHT